jgi:hypothetical protein
MIYRVSAAKSKAVQIRRTILQKLTASLATELVLPVAAELASRD